MFSIKVSHYGNFNDSGANFNDSGAYGGGDVDDVEAGVENDVVRMICMSITILKAMIKIMMIMSVMITMIKMMIITRMMRMILNAMTTMMILMKALRVV